MKIAAHVVIGCAAAAALLASGCNYVKPIMYIDIANRSGQNMRNLELKYPTGSFGLPELRNEQTHRRMTPMGAPCKFSLAFEDQAGKKYTGDYDLGAKCPTEVAFEVGAAMNVGVKKVQP
jgi:hypothetical protein